MPRSNSKLWYQQRKEMGLCPQCGNPAQEGKVLCFACAQKQNTYIQSEGKKKHAAYMRSLYNRRRTEGLCVKCGKPANENSAYCDFHKRRPRCTI